MRMLNTLIVLIMLTASCASAQLEELRRENEMLRKGAQIMEPGNYVLSCDGDPKTSVKFLVPDEQPYCARIERSK